METLQQLFQSDLAIEGAIIDGVIWGNAGTVQADPSQWNKFADVGLFKDVNFPPFKKASEIQLGVKYPIRGMTKMVLKHGPSVSISQTNGIVSFSKSDCFFNQILVQSDDFSMFLPHRFKDLEVPESVEGRFFTIVGFKKCQNAKETPLIRFD